MIKHNYWFFYKSLIIPSKSSSKIVFKMLLAFSLVSKSIEWAILQYAYINIVASSKYPKAGITSGTKSKGDIRYPKAPIIIALSIIDTFDNE